MERIDTAHSIWLFDRDRMLYRRLPRGADPDAPAPDSEWEQYFGLELEDDGSFTVALNAERTRLLRSYRDDTDAGAEGETSATTGASAPGEPGQSTNELRLEVADGTGES